MSDENDDLADFRRVGGVAVRRVRVSDTDSERASGASSVIPTRLRAAS